ncbi:MarR family winged helix-turn-helix transcriptional regulator [Amorphoplanes digitatis]|uniref:DNA-binding MarR family transcriptional regulator n=1 Tax=Actinoplanes digitatis TaxID=1868 RepID=A0A7W7HVW6_9ACTN|nr:MarR family transcriptional regulator [Actinoplanes digitatis]MBB4761673.1 DNA-binding MarR family transcriptional regulator [Actinoplanes digitatis]GID90783.1 MarR family transcriptional regulator [Actinoplanes digitatis]
MTRDVVIDTIQRGIMAMARRARTTAADLHPALTLVDFSMLDLLDERDGCRAVDLAAYFQLDKSTVSRQVAGLSQAGLIHVAPGAGGRGQLWRLTKAGREALAGARRRRLEAMSARFAGWSDRDVARFADYIRRYNEGGDDLFKTS